MLIAHIYEILIPSYPECDKCWASLGPLFLLGISYATYAAALWGTIPYLVEADTLGTAFGICTSFQNFATVIAPPILGTILESTKDCAPKSYKGHFYVEVFFIVVSVLAFMCNYGVAYFDKKKRLIQ